MCVRNGDNLECFLVMMMIMMDANYKLKVYIHITWGMYNLQKKKKKKLDQCN